MQLLPEDTPGKVGGPPGDAFEVVYGKVTDKVRRNMHAADPVLGELIRRAHAPSPLSVPPSAAASGMAQGSVASTLTAFYELCR